MMPVTTVFSSWRPMGIPPENGVDGPDWSLHRPGGRHRHLRSQDPLPTVGGAGLHIRVVAVAVHGHRPVRGTSRDLVVPGSGHLHASVGGTHIGEGSRCTHPHFSVGGVYIDLFSGPVDDHIPVGGFSFHPVRCLHVQAGVGGLVVHHRVGPRCVH